MLFVDEYNVIANVLRVNGHNIRIKIKCFICHTPARVLQLGSTHTMVA